MLFQPAILALLFASAATVAMLLGAAPFAVDVFRHWDITNGSERQLQLERRTYLMSTLLTFVMATELLALLLFVSMQTRWRPCLSAPCARWEP